MSQQLAEVSHTHEPRSDEAYQTYKTASKAEREMAQIKERRSEGPYIHLDFSFQLSGDLKFGSTLVSDDNSVDSSVVSGLRNSLHSSYTYEDLESFLRDNNELDDSASFGEDLAVTPSWRLDPRESESDWTIVIESETDGSIAEYNIHKHVVSNGYKKSDFFTALFSLAEQEEKTDEDCVVGCNTTLMHGEAAKLVPDMFDYLYSADDKLKISTETAVGLRHLSEFFAIRALATEVVSFIYEDMSLENVLVYLNSALAFDDLETVNLCAKRCAENIKKIGPFSPFLRDIDPSFFLEIISSPHILRREQCSSHLSLLVSVYCNLHRDRLSPSVFGELTCPELLPKICEDSALSLMVFEAQIVPESSKESTELSCLQKRCISTLVFAIKKSEDDEASESTRNGIRAALSDLPKKVLVEQLTLSLNVPPSNSRLVEL